MGTRHSAHFAIVGWGVSLVHELAERIAAKSEQRFSYILHPRHVPSEYSPGYPRAEMHFFRDDLAHAMPEPDRGLLTALEQDGVPTIHNMILGDRVVARLAYDEALRYATFLARRLITLFGELRPSAVIASFDGIHSGISLAVARYMHIPWFALNFSALPSGLACFCDRMSPAARVQLSRFSSATLRAFAEKELAEFEAGRTRAPAYTTPSALSLLGQLRRLPARYRTAVRALRKSREREYWKFTEELSNYALTSALAQLRRVHGARKALSRTPTVAEPPQNPYILFGLHMQPESSIDVWAPFFSNQMWVIELISRSVAPSHRVLVKIHKSDAAKYDRKQLEQMRLFPGVELVEPFADARRFVERADLIVAIQGTMGLEAALLGKPVVMLGDSPIACFPSVSRVSAIDGLPSLIRRKLRETSPTRSAIIDAYATFLSPFMPASDNDWNRRLPEAEIDRYVALFGALANHLSERAVTPAPRASALFE